MGNCIGAKSTKNSSKMKNGVLKGTQKMGAKELKLNYLITNDTKILGQGSFGKVFLTHNISNPEHKVAIKVMNKKKL
jgi:serine/threonine protein kinase